VPFRNAQTHLEDILQSIDHIDEFLAGIDFEEYRQDRKTRSAVERELQIITEAAIRLGDEAETLCLDRIGRDFAGWQHSSACVSPGG
jgi:uncharacterized protein with HEPN domain